MKDITKPLSVCIRTKEKDSTFITIFLFGCQIIVQLINIPYFMPFDLTPAYTKHIKMSDKNCFFPACGRQVLLFFVEK